jgi:hypothetical protein
MPGSARLDVPGVLHLVMGRAIEKKQILISEGQFRTIVMENPKRVLQFDSKEGR